MDGAISKQMKCIIYGLKAWRWTEVSHQQLCKWMHLEDKARYQDKRESEIKKLSDA